MNNFSYAVISGLCFGLWPLFVNKSLLSGFVSAFFICLVSIIIFFPMAWSSLGEIRNANISMGGVVSLFSACVMCNRYSFFDSYVSKYKGQRSKHYIHNYDLLSDCCTSYIPYIP